MRTIGVEAHDLIQVRGARENNLDDISIDIPKHRLTVFTGLSGSGKSSLVFDTIAAESRRLIDETYSTFLQSLMPSLSRPDVDSLSNLTAAIIVDQEPMRANSRSTVGTATDTYALLRILFSKISTPSLGSAAFFSFNNPEGMCPRCGGVGTIDELDRHQLVDAELSLNEGAVRIPDFTVGSWHWNILIESGFFDPDRKLADYSPQQWETLLDKPATKIAAGGRTLTFEGLRVKLRRLYLGKDRTSVKPRVRKFLDGASTSMTCPACLGSRLNPRALEAKVNGRNIAECASLQIVDLLRFLNEIPAAPVAPVVESLSTTLHAMVDLGLGYLALDRQSATLSGGESQRVRMARHLVSSLTDITYVFDEPTIGLHPHDTSRMNAVLQRLRDKGNTVLVIEHKPETIRIADLVVDLGPGAGRDGGRICYVGDVRGLIESETLTGRHLDSQVELRRDPRPSRGSLPIRGASMNNLRDVDVDVPLGVLTVVTGVAGSGKSSLVHGSLGRRPEVLIADQSGLRGSSRGNVATYTGLLDILRKAFARANHVEPSLFSANSAGACPHCNGLGVIYTDLGLMAPVASTCPICEGRRYSPEALRYLWNGKNINQVLGMSVVEAEQFVSSGARQILRWLADVGLGYLTLGQTLTQLSGGERQRLKLAVSLVREEFPVIVLDEPTAGLHLADVDQLLQLFDQMVDMGRSVIVIEHHLAVVAHADWLIDLGPGAGHEGGRIVFEGTPRDLAERADTLTGWYLSNYVARRPSGDPMTSSASR